jgi:hypothetical protein
MRLEAVTFDATDAGVVAAFWAGLLERSMVPEADGVFLPGDETQVGLRFVTADTQPSNPRRLHLHLTSDTLDQQQETVEMALRLGARYLDVGQGPDDKHVVLADPGGNELCVIEPGNNYLVGTGYLGEVTCDGNRRVGLFWRDALGWPLVWDHGDQTAIQSPQGGTKIAWDSWGGQPRRPMVGRVRQRFDLVSTDLATDTERLLSLGATYRAELPDGIELTDPDANEFHLR